MSKPGRYSREKQVTTPKQSSKATFRRHEFGILTRVQNDAPTHRPSHPLNNQPSHRALQQYSSTHNSKQMRLTRHSCWDFNIFTGLRHAGQRVSRPREGAFPRIPLAEFGVGAVLSAGTPRADTWSGRGTVVVARTVWCRTIEPTPSGT